MSTKDQDDSPKSINEGNWPSLLAIVVANIAVFAVVVGTNISFKDAMSALDLLLPLSLGLVIVRVINGQMTPLTKNQLIFWTRQHPLPACRAFDHLTDDDDRIDMKALRDLVGPFPTDPREQNTTWYELYVKLDESPSVMQANRNFLLTRDYAAIGLVLMVVLGIAALWFASLRSPVIFLYVVGLVLQFLLARRAARNYGLEVVTNVLARAAANHAVEKKATRKGAAKAEPAKELAVGRMEAGTRAADATIERRPVKFAFYA